MKKIANYKGKCTSGTPKAAPSGGKNCDAPKKGHDSASSKEKHGKYTYTRLYNHIYDAIEPRKFSGAQYAVFMYIYRQTIGYQGRSIIFKSQDVAYKTRYSRRAIDKAYKSLFDDNIIKCADEQKKGVQINFMKRDWTPIEE